MNDSNTFPWLDPQRVRTVLALPFEDQELVPYVQNALPHASITTFRKQDLAGLSTRKLLQTIRRQRYDLVIASLHSSAVRRSLSSVQLLLILSRAKQRAMRLEDGMYWGIEPRSMLLDILPRLLTGMLMGGALVTWTYVHTIIRRPVSSQRDVRPSLDKDRTGKTVLFLRTDLAGTLRAGGSVSHVKGMVHAFLRAGYNVVYVGDARQEALLPAVTQVQIAAPTFLDFLDEFQFLHYNRKMIRELDPIIRRYKPVLVYQRHSILNFAGGAVARRFGIPLVLEANDSEVWIKKHWSRLVFENLAVRCEAKALQNADRIAVISRGVRDQLAPYNIPDDRFLLNPNGVDPGEFHPDIDGAAIRDRYNLQGKVVVGFIGTFTRWHGVETLFDAAELSAENDDRLRYLLIGEGDLRTKLQKRAVDLNLQQLFVFTGLVPHHEAPQYLAACDILVSPHLGFEDGTKFFGSPTKLFEYMAMGKAIIAGKLEQIEEIIVDGVNGLHMVPGDATQLSQLITKLADDPGLRKHIGAQARTDVVKNHAWASNVDRILNSLQNLNQ